MFLRAFTKPSALRALQRTRAINQHIRPFSIPNRAMAITAWDRLIRYISAKDNQIRYGEPIVSGDKPDIDDLAQKGGLKVKILEGPTPIEAKPTGQEDEVKQLLGPLTPKDVPSVRCIGLNYKTHILETGFDLPKNPTLFYKSSQTVSDTRSPTPIPKLGQTHLDYEGELTIVIGKDCKNISEDKALDYVAGYVSGNDVSCRDWQMEKDKAGMMPQWGFSKSFDKYAPLGPAIVSTKLLGDASGLRLKTYVNGELRQDSDTSDLCFGVRKLVSFLSTGQTLAAGTIIMTGTPGGVGIGMKPEPKYLKDGDEVVVEIEGIGKVVNVMRFE
ncbi:Fumarylacetoacetate hydrolase domain-containing protein 2-like [Pseudocercospora fuligena]|uniref:Fumarylacetoacetate hydrolase domain-containing protein 2-like n=1 Tax=Pseudocercospora fuligena TaxID=685502 RepID=A0A8H6VKK9_9PEZI|nr:Fumarylacetoacetate hydrolase domain-containing protein 2-like [Pseudocercospora fuligena]